MGIVRLDKLSSVSLRDLCVPRSVIFVIKLFHSHKGLKVLHKKHGEFIRNTNLSRRQSVVVHHFEISARRESLRSPVPFGRGWIRAGETKKAF